MGTIMTLTEIKNIIQINTYQENASTDFKEQIGMGLLFNVGINYQKFANKILRKRNLDITDIKVACMESVVRNTGENIIFGIIDFNGVVNNIWELYRSKKTTKKTNTKLVERVMRTKGVKVSLKESEQLRKEDNYMIGSELPSEANVRDFVKILLERILSAMGILMVVFLVLGLIDVLI